MSFGHLPVGIAGDSLVEFVRSDIAGVGAAAGSWVVNAVGRRLPVVVIVNHVGVPACLNERRVALAAESVEGVVEADGVPGGVDSLLNGLRAVVGGGDVEGAEEVLGGGVEGDAGVVIELGAVVAEGDGFCFGHRLGTSFSEGGVGGEAAFTTGVADGF